MFVSCVCSPTACSRECVRTVNSPGALFGKRETSVRAREGKGRLGVAWLGTERLGILID